MTTRLNGCFVAFDRDIREDDAESILNAIRQIRGVLAVTTDQNETDANDWLIRQREKFKTDVRFLATPAQTEVLCGLVGKLNQAGYRGLSPRTVMLVSMDMQGLRRPDGSLMFQTQGRVIHGPPALPEMWSFGPGNSRVS